MHDSIFKVGSERGNPDRTNPEAQENFGGAHPPRRSGSTKSRQTLVSSPLPQQHRGTEMSAVSLANNAAAAWPIMTSIVLTLGIALAILTLS